MSKPASFIAVLALASAFPAAALAQASAPDHSQHQEPASTSSGHQSHQQGQPGTQAGQSPAADHQTDCNCCCCQMMRQMMMQMHGMHQQGTAPAGQTPEHQGHETPRPN
jgi:hypothetical protein